MRRAAAYLTCLVGMLCSTGCASTVCMQSKRNLERFEGGAQAVFVTNPELRREYEILRASGIYPLTSQPDRARRLTLGRLQQYGRCGNSLILSALTLGVVPGFLQGALVFEYDLEVEGMTERWAHELPVYERISVWEWLVRRKDDEVLAAALAWSERAERPSKALDASGASHSEGFEKND